jgi:hypothetical protein
VEVRQDGAANQPLISYAQASTDAQDLTSHREGLLAIESIRAASTSVMG